MRGSMAQSRHRRTRRLSTGDTSGASDVCRGRSLRVARGLALDSLCLSLRLTRSLRRLTHFRQQYFTLGAGQVRGITKLVALLARDTGARQRLTHRRLPLGVSVKNAGALGDVTADGGRQIDTAERAEVVAPAEQISPHFNNAELAAAYRAHRDLMPLADADQAAAFIVGERMAELTLEAENVRDARGRDEGVRNRCDGLSAESTDEGGGTVARSIGNGQAAHLRGGGGYHRTPPGRFPGAVR